jgi:hypothetical protein
MNKSSLFSLLNKWNPWPIGRRELINLDLVDKTTRLVRYGLAEVQKFFSKCARMFPILFLASTFNGWLNTFDERLRNNPQTISPSSMARN